MSLLFIVSTVLGIGNRVEGVGIDGLMFEVGFARRESVIGDPGSGEVEPRDVKGAQIPNAGNQRSMENGDNQERGRVSKDWGQEGIRTGQGGAGENAYK